MWFTSDLHFGHKNIIKYTQRQNFVSRVDEMNDWIIQQWNSYVKENDSVYHLGDFTLSKNIDLIKSWVSRLNGRLIFLNGNHDVWLRKYPEGELSFFGYKEFSLLDTAITGKKKHVVMFHFPIEHWHWQHSGAWHLHGHCHGSIDVVNEKLYRLDVGWDAKLDGKNSNHRPIHWDEICIHMHNKEEVIRKYHHETQG